MWHSLSGWRLEASPARQLGSSSSTYPSSRSIDLCLKESCSSSWRITKWGPLEWWIDWLLGSVSCSVIHVRSPAPSWAQRSYGSETQFYTSREWKGGAPIGLFPFRRQNLAFASPCQIAVLWHGNPWAHAVTIVHEITVVLLDIRFYIYLSFVLNSSVK